MTNISPVSSKSSAESAKLVVMIVDRDVLVRTAIGEYLRDCGYLVIEGVSAEDVWTVLEDGRRIDIVLSDVDLPGDTDGFALASMIRERYPGIDVVLASGASKLAGKAGDLCDESPLKRPYEPAEVMKRIHLLRERRRQSEMKQGETE